MTTIEKLRDLKTHLQKQRDLKSLRIEFPYVVCVAVNRLSNGETYKRKLKYDSNGSLVETIRQ